MHLCNGQAADSVSLLDRGLLYGHSAFTTIRVYQRQALLLQKHLKRMSLACERLGLPFDASNAANEIEHLCERFSESDFIIRLMQTMGVGGRGYASPQNASGNRVLSAFELPILASDYRNEGINLGLVEQRLASQPSLAGLKHGNRLEQILARSQWHPDWQEALMMDDNNQVIEATQSNLFVLANQSLLTPDLNQCGVAGIMREMVIEVAQSELGLDCHYVSLSAADVHAADAVFVTNCVNGVWPVKQFQGTLYSDFDLACNLNQHLANHAAISPL